MTLGVRRGIVRRGGQLDEKLASPTTVSKYLVAAIVSALLPGRAYALAITGAALVLPGSRDGQLGDDDAIASFWGDGGSLGFSFATRVAGIGDLDGDGIDNLCIDAMDFFLGPLSGMYLVREDTDMLLEYIDDDDYRHQLQVPVDVTAAPDLDGDGTDDVVVGAEWEDGRGAAVITRADLAVTRVTDLPLRLQQARGHFWPIHIGVETGDFDGDGATDIAVGGDGPYDLDGTPTACCWIEYGPFSGVREIGGGNLRRPGGREPRGRRGATRGGRPRPGRGRRPGLRHGPRRPPRPQHRLPLARPPALNG